MVAEGVTQVSGLSLFRILGIHTSQSIGMATDACPQGFGAVFGCDWLSGLWPKRWLILAKRSKSHSVPFLELAAIAIAVNTWGSRLERMHVVISSDCMPMVEAINRNYSPLPHILFLLRAITILSLTHNFTLTSTHIAGSDNRAPDLLSRNNIQQFQQEFPSMVPVPTKPNTTLPQA